MTRLEVETEVLQIMGLIRSDGSTNDADVSLRTYIQNKIQAAVDAVCYDGKWKFRRKPFGAYVRAPSSITLTVTQGNQSGTVAAGVTPSSSSWIGGHVYFADNGFPLTVTAVSSQTLTFAEAVVASSAAYSATMYFDAIQFPSDCTGIDLDTMTLTGHQRLTYLAPDKMKIKQGYLNGMIPDYGFGEIGRQTISSPDVDQPTHWSYYYQPRISSTVTPVIMIYPYPDGVYSLSWEGWRMPTAVTVSGTATGDSDVPDIPTHFHRMYLLPMVKLMMTEWPGFELSNSEKQTLQLMVAEGRNRFDKEQNDAPDDVQSFMPPMGMVGPDA